MKSLRLLIVTLLVALPLAAQAELAVSGKAKVSFTAKGPGGLKITGKTSDLTVSEDEDNITFTVDMKTVTTGIGLRDRHMKNKYVEVAEYPTVTIVVSRSAFRFPDGKTPTSGTIEALFTTHGQEKEVSLHYEVKKQKDRFQVEGDFNFNVEEHGIKIPTYLGVTVYPTMKASAKFKLENK